MPRETAITNGWKQMPNRYKNFALMSVLAGSFLQDIPVSKAAAATQTYIYSGSSYTLTTVNTTFNDSAALLQAQPWWGNRALADVLSNLVALDLGYGTAGRTDFGVIFASEVYPTTFLISAYGNGVASCDSNNACVGLNSDIHNFAVTSALLEEALETIDTINNSLHAASANLNAVTTNTDLIFNGSHGRPLARMAPVGKSTVWLSGDWGRDDHGRRDGDSSLAEFGLGHNFGTAQLNVAVGQTWAKQDLIEGGKVDADGQYAMLEALIPVSEQHGLFATIAAFGHWGESETRRGYEFLSTPSSSKGKADTEIWGARIRLDMVNALALGTTGISPYVDLSYTDVKINGYTEKSGPAPARFDSLSDHYTEGRIGFNTRTPLGFNNFDLIANLEGAHRFQDRTAGVSGEVTGLFTFKQDGEKVTRDWLKAGVGLEGSVGAGTASFMLNGTSRSDMPKAWLAASYQLNF